MPTPAKGPRLGGGPAHERLLLANLATQLFEHRSITTTEAKAKRLRPLAERLVTFAKRGDLASRRRVLQVVRDKSVVHFLFTEIAPAMAEREGGYTRIVKIGPRKGDNAPMAVISLCMEPVEKKQTVKAAEAATKRAAADSEKKADETPAALVDTAADTAAVDDAAVDDAPVDAAAADDATEAPATEADATKEASAASKYSGAAAPLEDGSAPEGYTIKGNEDSMKYHLPDGQWFEQTVAEVWFDTEDNAKAAGFTKAGETASDD